MEKIDDFVIRSTTEADIPQVMRFIRELAVYENMLDEVVATEEMMKEWIFEKHTAEALIAEEAGVPVGFALFFHNYSTFVGRAGLYLEDLFVLPEYRGKKYGKRLLQRLAQIALERNCGRMEWSCLDWNAPSIAFYKSLGACPMDEWTVYRLAGETLKAVAQGADQAGQ